MRAKCTINFFGVFGVFRGEYEGLILIARKSLPLQGGDGQRG